jgi:hypothetical protein
MQASARMTPLPSDTLSTWFAAPHAFAAAGCLVQPGSMGLAQRALLKDIQQATTMTMMMLTSNVQTSTKIEAKNLQCN